MTLEINKTVTLYYVYSQHTMYFIINYTEIHDKIVHVIIKYDLQVKKTLVCGKVYIYYGLSWNDNMVSYIKKFLPGNIQKRWHE